MKLSQHTKARTTPALRKEIQESNLPVSVLATKYNLSWATVKKWKTSASLYDKSSRPKKLRTDLTETEEEKICFLRKQFKYTIDEIYVILESEFKGRNIYPMKIYRCLRRNGLNVLPKEFVEAERKIKRFKKYGIGYLHIDFIFTKRIDNKRFYVFTCIDRVSKLAFIIFTNTHTIKESVRFLEEVIKYYPYRINYILTDNGTEFTDTGYTNYERNKTKKTHPFKERCKEEKIQLRHTKFKSPWTNGMVERFNRKIKENVIKLKVFETPNQLAKDLVAYINRYNTMIKLKGLGYVTPVQYLIEKGKISETQGLNLNQTLITYRY